MDIEPDRRFPLVRARAPDVDEDYDDDEREDEQLSVEIGDCRALPYTVPFRVRAWGVGAGWEGFFGGGHGAGD